MKSDTARRHISLVENSPLISLKRMYVMTMKREPAIPKEAEILTIKSMTFTSWDVNNNGFSTMKYSMEKYVVVVLCCLRLSLTPVRIALWYGILPTYILRKSFLLSLRSKHGVIIPSLLSPPHNLLMRNFFLLSFFLLKKYIHFGGANPRSTLVYLWSKHGEIIPSLLSPILLYSFYLLYIHFYIFFLYLWVGMLHTVELFFLPLIFFYIFLLSPFMEKHIVFLYFWSVGVPSANFFLF